MRSWHEPGWQIACDVAAGRFEDLESLFLREGGEPPVVIWEPSPETCGDDRLIGLLEHWRALRRGRAMPTPAEVRPEDIRFALGYVLLVDVVDEGADFYYRLYGSEVSKYYSDDLTGRRASDFTSRTARFLASVYRAAMIRREPVFTRHQPGPEVSVLAWWRLLLPLGEGQSVQRFLVGMIPDDPLGRRGVPRVASVQADEQ